MKKFWLIFFSFSFLFAYDTLWFRVYDTGEYEDSYGIGIDPWGNIIICGERGFGILLIKYSPAGEVIWSKTIEDEDRVWAPDLAVDKEGNIIAVGEYYRGPQDFGGYIVKCDNEGNILWFRKFPINGGCVFNSVVCDDSNNIFVVGWYEEENNINIILIKYSPHGETIWVKRYDLGEEFEAITGLIRDREGNIIGTGAIGILIPSIYDLLTIKFNKNGEIVWISRIDFNENDWGEDVAIDSANNIYICGFTGNFSLIHSFIIKYTPYGDTLWKRFYEDYYSHGTAVAIDKLGDILVAGYVKDIHNISNTLLIKYSPFGDTIFSKWYNFNSDRGMWAWRMVLVNDSNYIYITGNFNNGRDWDIYLMKLTSQPTIKEKVSHKILFTLGKEIKEVYDITGKRIKDLKRVKKGVYFFKYNKNKYFKGKLF